jgi:hypothetical protein
MQYRIFCFAVSVFLLVKDLSAQTGGNNTFEFLNLPAVARVAALGGNHISVLDNDINLSFQNPAVLNEGMKNSLSFNYTPYFADISFGYAVYGFHVKKAGMLSAGIQFINYGDFDLTDETGIKTGTFSAAEYAFNLAWSKKLYEGIQAGITLKTVYSKLESYKSTGLMADLGMHYNSPSNHFSAGVVIKNAGMQLNTYTSGNREPLPFEIQAGLSYLMPKAPFRLSMTLTHLEKWNLGYINPDEQDKVDPLTGDTTVLKVSLYEKISRHFTPAAEILVTKNFHLRLAYNFMRRRDLAFDSVKSISGLSFGVGFRVSKFHFSYALASYNSAGSSNHFSITTKLGSFRKASQPTEKN